MLSSRKMRALFLLVIGAVFLNITWFMIFRYQHATLQRVDFKKFNILLRETEENIFNKTEDPHTSQTSPYFSDGKAKISAATDNNQNYAMTRAPETTIAKTALIVETTTEGFTTNSSLVGKRRNEKRKVRRALCHELPRGTGLMPLLLPANTSQIVRSVIERGGHFKFVGCKARQSIAVLVTSRYGENINETFFLHMHTFLIQQESEYHIFVIGQNNTSQVYNQGRLFNIGFLEVRQRFKYVSCFIFHDETVLPLDSRNLYRCTWYPRQLAVEVERSDKTTFYPKFGYAVALTSEQFYNANGFTNGQWTMQWTHHYGYDNMLQRLLAENYVIERSPAVHGKYSIANSNVVYTTRKRIRQIAKYPPMFDGLCTLAYTIACYDTRDLYTYISVVFPEEYLTDTTTYSQFGEL